MAAGSIKRRRYKRADGSTHEVWRAQHPDPVKGGAAKIERQFATKREAERWMTSQRSAIQRGEWIDPADGERTFSEVADEWRSTTWTELEPKTVQGYQSILGQLNDRFGRAQVAALQTDVIQGYVNELAKAKATNTVRRYFTVLGSIMRVAVERRYLAANPCDSVRLPRKRAAVREQLFLTPEEVAALAEDIDPRYRVLVYTAAYTGLRAGELGGLRRRDVDLLRSRLRVERALKEVGGRLIFGEPKSDASRRWVSLPKFLRGMLDDHLAAPAAGGNDPDALVFTTPTGKPIRHNLFYKRVFRPAVRRRYCAAEGCGEELPQDAERCPECDGEEVVRVLPPEKAGLRFHDLRHTCASLSLAVAPNLHVVKERLGHEDIRTTINVYGHLVPSVDEALADGLGRLFDEAEPADNVTELRRATDA